MVKIPRYQSQVLPQTTSAVPLQASSFTAGAEGISKIAGKLDEFTSKWYEVEVLREKTKAKTNYDLEVGQIELEATKDQDISETNLQKYQQRIKEAQDKHLTGLSNAPTKAAMQASFEVDSFNSYSKISNDFYKRRLEEQEFAFMEGLIVKEQNYINEFDPKKRQKLKNDILDSTKEHRKIGILSTASATSVINEVDKWDKKWQDNQIQIQINQNPEIAEKEIIKGAEGIYGKITADDKASWLKVIEAAKNKKIADQEKIYKRRREEKTVEFETKLFDGKLSVLEIKEEFSVPESEGGVPRSTLTSMFDGIYSAQEKEIKYIDNEYDTYSDYANLVSTVIESKLDRAMAREAIIKAYSNTKISGEEGKVLSKINDIMQNIENSRVTNPIIRAFKGIKDSNKTEEDLAKDLHNFLIEVSKPDAKPEEVSKKIIQDRQKKNYPEYADWEEGKPYDSIIGTVDFLNRRADGMPIIRMK